MTREAWDVRQEYEGRPSICALLGLIVGLTAVSHPVNLLGLVLLIWLRSLKGRCWCALLFVVGLVIAPTTPPSLNGRQFIHTFGTVAGTVQQSGALQSCFLRVSNGTYSLLSAHGPKLQYGDQIEVRGIAVPVSVSEEREGHLLTLGDLKAQNEDIKILETPSGLSALSSRFRTSFERYTAANLSPDVAATIDASVIGIDAIPPQILKEFRASGAISLASVSGLQILLLTGLVLAFLGQNPIQRAVQLGTLSLILIVYIQATGLHPGAVRAGLMSLFLLIPYLFRRDPDVLSALALSAVLELLWRPIWVFDFGFQMSFLLLTLMSLWLPHRSKFAQANAVSRLRFGTLGLVAIFIAAAPMIAYQTGNLHFESPISGALIVPAIPPMFVFALAGWLISLITPGVGAMVLKALVAPFAGWVLTCAESATQLKIFAVQIPPFSAYLLVPIYVLFALGARFTSNAFSGLHSRTERTRQVENR